MNLMNLNLPSLSQDINMKTYILDPLSVIIKLAILANKPLGTKVVIKNNMIQFQNPCVIQFAIRYWTQTSKMELHYLYNPIKIACKTFLNKEQNEDYERIKDLFQKAQQGLKNLIETYKSCSMVNICLNYYFSIIATYIDSENCNDALLQKDNMTSLYTEEVIEKLRKIWTKNRIKIILDLVNFLENDKSASNNVTSLENIISDIDLETQTIIATV